MSNLEKMFIEDAPQQVNELNNVESLSSYETKRWFCHRGKRNL
jgi:hypothetical protein